MGIREGTGSGRGEDMTFGSDGKQQEGDSLEHVMLFPPYTYSSWGTSILLLSPPQEGPGNSALDIWSPCENERETKKT